MKILSIRGYSIVTKLLAIYLLILLTVGTVAGINLLSSKQVENTLVPLINSDVKQIIQNAALARELNISFAELNLILNTFTENQDILNTKGKELLDRLQNRTTLSSQTPKITDSLKQFNDVLNQIFEKCHHVTQILQTLNSTNKTLQEQLNKLDSSVTNILLKSKSSAKEYSQLPIEQISATIPDIRNMLLQIKLLLNDLTRGHLYSNIRIEDDEKPVLAILQDVSGNLLTIVTAGEELLPIGNQLITLVQQYQKHILDYHKALENFRKEFEKMHIAQTRVMTVMQDIDMTITASTGKIQENITENLISSRYLTLWLSIGIGGIVIFAGFFAFRMTRPLGELAEIAAQLALGNINCSIYEPKTRDEIGTLFQVFKQLIDTTRETTEAVEKIADGNLSVEMKERSEYDRMMQALNRMIQRLNDIMKETNGMIQSVEHGKLDIRGNAEVFEGGWRELIIGVNHLIGGLSSAVSEKTALGKEMELAKKIQTCLLPEKPEIQGYDIAASCDPADEVGGDYYDVISVAGYEWIVIGDVSGHGVSAGLVMMMVQTAIYTVLLENPVVSPSALLSAINKTIYNNIVKMHESKHMTIIVLAVEKEGLFAFSGLHENILIWRSSTGKVDSIETDGMWIGIDSDISNMLVTQSLKLESNDCMVLYTDGITESRGKDRKMFGEDRLVNIIESAGNQSAHQIHAEILNSLQSYEKRDDVTLFVMKRV